MAVSVATPKTVLTSTPREIFASTDTGESWEGRLGVGKHFRFRYCRSIVLRADDICAKQIPASDHAQSRRWVALGRRVVEGVPVRP